MARSHHIAAAATKDNLMARARLASAARRRCLDLATLRDVSPFGLGLIATAVSYHAAEAYDYAATARDLHDGAA